MTDDYRNSHLERGAVYDDNLDREPFSRYMARREAMILRQIVRKYFADTIPLYLDFACGTGRITSLLEGFAIRSHAVDISRSMIEVARRKCRRTQFSVLDVTREDFDLPPADLITAFRFFGNAQDELRASVLSALRTKLSPSGYLVFNNHRNPSAPVNALSRVAGCTEQLDLSAGKMRRLLRASGFRVVRTYGIGAWIFPQRVMANGRLLESGLARFLEPLSLSPGVGQFCPDIVTVARRM